MKNKSSLPHDFDVRIRHQLGDDYSDFVESLQQPVPVSIRINPEKNCQIEGDYIPWTKFGIYLNERPVFTLDPHFHAGAYYVQEASSMLLEQALEQSIDLSKPLRVLDLSAAPGGKSTHIVSLLSKDSLLVSNEVIRSRASILSENMQKWGYPNVMVTCNDPKDFTALEGFFDVIIIDAPCSGEGLFRKDPESMKEWSNENVQLCALRQRRILNDVIPALKKNGILIYSTCTFNEAENEDNLIWCARNGQFDFKKLQLNTDWGIETVRKDGAIGYRCYPHRVKGEGFFIAVMQNKSEVNEARIRARKKFGLPPKKITEKLDEWMLNPFRFQFIQQESLLIALPSEQFEDIQYLSNQLNVITKGTALAEVKHEKLIPEHAFALSALINQDYFQQIHLNLEQALAYLRKENFQLADPRKGFGLIKYQGSRLGWVNLLGNRFNNLYPSAWRIRMSG